MIKPRFPFRPTMLLPVITVVLLVGAGLAHSTTRIQTFAQAVTLLRSRIAQDQLYPRSDCLLFMDEGQQLLTFEVAIRRKQGGNCLGDSNLAPVLDRFQVRRDGAIFWYDPVHDRYTPYSQFKHQRSSQQKER